MQIKAGKHKSLTSTSTTKCFNVCDRENGVTPTLSPTPTPHKTRTHRIMHLRGDGTEFTGISSLIDGPPRFFGENIINLRSAASIQFSHGHGRAWVRKQHEYSFHILQLIHLAAHFTPARLVFEILQQDFSRGLK